MFRVWFGDGRSDEDVLKDAFCKAFQSVDEGDEGGVADVGTV